LSSTKGCELIRIKLVNVKLPLTADSFNLLILHENSCQSIKAYFNSHNLLFLHLSAKLSYFLFGVSVKAFNIMYFATRDSLLTNQTHDKKVKSSRYMPEVAYRGVEV
jgi:hypothetical protein